MAAVAGVAAVVVLVASGGDDGARTAPPPKSGGEASLRPLREQVGDVILMRFNGTRVPAYVRRILRRGRATGVTLFSFNATSRGQLRALTKQLQNAAGGDALIAVDQEGGIARRLRWASPTGQASQPTPDAAAAASRATAKALRDGGINVNFAPVVDVASGEGSAVRSRAYPGDANRVAATSSAAVRAYKGSDVAPTLKHFPGFGRATANTDDAPVKIDAGRDELASDLAPFRTGIAAGAPLVMVAHALYPAYDGAWIASQSRPIVTGLLRGELGFRGVIATDSMEADAVLSRSSVEDAAVYSIYAGCDLLVLTGRASQLPVYERLLDEARRSPEFRARIEESAARVRALKRTLGLRTPSGG